jgi:hypothetical protein
MGIREATVVFKLFLFHVFREIVFCDLGITYLKQISGMYTLAASEHTQFGSFHLRSVFTFLHNLFIYSEQCVKSVE